MVMTKEEWTKKLIVQLASGHGNVVQCQSAKDWLAGKAPPLDDDWEPQAVKKYKEGKDDE
jgi:hypothetical protein